VKKVEMNCESIYGLYSVVRIRGNCEYKFKEQFPHLVIVHKTPLTSSASSSSTPTTSSTSSSQHLQPAAFANYRMFIAHLTSISEQELSGLK
jgi:hypothetical protein